MDTLPTGEEKPAGVTPSAEGSSHPISHPTTYGQRRLFTTEDDQMSVLRLVSENEENADSISVFRANLLGGPSWDRTRDLMLIKHAL